MLVSNSNVYGKVTKKISSYVKGETSSQYNIMTKTQATGRKPHVMTKQKYFAYVSYEHTRSGVCETFSATSSMAMAKLLNNIIKDRPGVRQINGDDIKDYFNRRTRTKQIGRKLEGVCLRRAW